MAQRDRSAASDHLGVRRTLGRLVGRVLSFLHRFRSGNDRVRVLARRSDGKILVVRNYYSRQGWALPGGGVKRSESRVQAARRECVEEVGLQIDSLRYVGCTYSYESYRPFVVYVYAGVVSGDGVVRRNHEIMAADWADGAQLPQEYRSFIDK